MIRSLHPHRYSRLQPRFSRVRGVRGQGQHKPYGRWFRFRIPVSNGARLGNPQEERYEPRLAATPAQAGADSAADRNSGQHRRATAPFELGAFHSDAPRNGRPHRDRLCNPARRLSGTAVFSSADDHRCGSEMFGRGSGHHQRCSLTIAHSSSEFEAARRDHQKLTAGRAQDRIAGLNAVMERAGALHWDGLRWANRVRQAVRSQCKGCE
jgi:hypothetical protein